MEFAAQDHQTHRRIVALLVALAMLAERAGGRSLPVRLLVLFLLRRAERAALGLIFGVTQTGCLAAPPSSRVDADRLARRLRALAAALCVLLRRACRFDRARIGRAPLGGVGHADRLMATQPRSTLRQHDTS